MRLTVGIVSAVIVVLSCKGSTEPSLCFETLSVSVDEGSSLRFSWSPSECGVLDLSVAPAAGTDIKWLLQPNVAPENAIYPPVVYGQIPPGPFAGSGVKPLYPGITYRVTLSRFRPEGSEYLAGETTFTVTQKWPQAASARVRSPN